MEKNEGEVEAIETELEEVESEDAETKETVDWKAKHDEVSARLKRAETKLQKSKIDKEVEKKVSQGLDRMDRAILRVEKITSEDEVSLVEDLMKETGKSLEQVLESKFFQHELKELRDARATKEATPSGTKRSGQSPRSEVDYWLAKGELPPADQPELRREYVNKKMAKASNTNRFTDDPVGAQVFK
jgi:uncharacterized membrane protein YgaE (UPF0421/DUF939 family)